MNVDKNINSNVRSAKGKSAAVIGIVANALMFAVKLIVGLAANSGAVLADSVNSLSDSITGIVNYFGFYLSGKPADRDHPFGHARYEYISSLIISGAIILVGYEFMVRSVKTIFDPVEVLFEPYMAVFLSVSVLLKIGMFFYFKTISVRINSDSFRGASVDSLSDAAITLVTLIGLIISDYFGASIDGYIGLFVALLVIISGFSSGKSAVSYILGKKPDPRLLRDMTDIISRNSEVIGVHDVLVHDYGPGRQIASAHIEVTSDMSLQEAHRLADGLEEEVQSKLHILMTIHVDPIAPAHSKGLARFGNSVLSVRKMPGGINPKKLRIKTSGGHCRIEFDVETDHENRLSDDEISSYFRGKICDDESLPAIDMDEIREDIQETDSKDPA